MIKRTLLFALLLKFSLVSFGENLSPDQEKALKQVMDQLNNPMERQEIIKNDPKAKEADQVVKETGGPHSEEVYKLAAEVMQTLAVEAKGDPDKMEELLEKARRDPASFADKFSPTQKARLKILAEKIGKSKSTP